MQDGMISFIESNHGHAEKYQTSEIVLRTGWQWFKEYLEGKIDITELRTKLGC